MFMTRSGKPLPAGDLDDAHYMAIHLHFFQDVHHWAGQVREIRTGKGGNWIFYPEYIDREMNGLSAVLADEDHHSQIGRVDDFARRASHGIAEIAAVHPVREEIGRCQLALLGTMMERAGFEMDVDLLEPEAFVETMISSFPGDNDPLARTIAGMAKSG